MNPSTRLILAALFLLTQIETLYGAAIAPDGTWYEFSFIEVGTAARGCFPADPADEALDCIPSSGAPTVFAPAPEWTFTVLTPFAILTVTDAFLHGDAFDVHDGGGLIFSTPAVAVDGSGCGDDPVVCLADPLTSHASFILGRGAHSITITPYATFDAGAGYFRVTPTPEPATGLLVGIAVLGLAGRRLRRKEA